MYSWERNVDDYKYESIQHGYEVIDDFNDDENELEISLDEMLELENEELELEELEGVL